MTNHKEKNTLKKVGSLVAVCKSRNGKTFYQRIGTVSHIMDGPNTGKQVISLSMLPLPHIDWDGMCYVFLDKDNPDFGNRKSEEDDEPF